MNRILKKLAVHGISNRKSALVYINGEIFLSKEHPDGIFQYLLKNNKLEEFVTDFYTKYYSNRYNKDDIKKIVKNEIQLMKQKKYFNRQIKQALWEYGFRNLSFTKLPIALGHYIKNFVGKEAIFLIIPSITNTSLNEIITNITNKYPNALIKDDDTNEILYKPSQYSEMTNEKSTFVCQILCDNMNGLNNINNSEFNKNLRNELSYITSEHINIDYFLLGLMILLKINLSCFNSVNNNDNDVADSIYLAIRDAVITTNKYFQNNNIDNYLVPPTRYKFEF